MRRISIELVGRNEAALRANLTMLKTAFPEINIINVPELLRYEMHSWEACGVAREYYPTTIPHIRAIDIDLERPLPMARYLTERDIREVLVVTGDAPQDMSRKIYPTVSTDIIRKFKDELPQVKVYAGIDQYRGNMRSEIYQIKRKLQAGADGFFTQPFFDLRLLEIYAEILEGQNVYWGVSPVLSAGSVRYWETKNNVIFPRGFEPTLEWNWSFARIVRRYLSQFDSKMYFMPIQSDLATYLRGVFRAQPRAE